VIQRSTGLASVDQTRAWQQLQIAHSILLVLPGNSYHVAACHGARCSEATLDFIERHLGAPVTGPGGKQGSAARLRCQKRCPAEHIGL
jgi:hypothetical protein